MCSQKTGIFGDRLHCRANCLGECYDPRIGIFGVRELRFRFWAELVLSVGPPDHFGIKYCPEKVIQLEYKIRSINDERMENEKSGKWESVRSPPQNTGQCLQKGTGNLGRPFRYRA